jgi:3-oxoacyl-[acyl-carrier-protein] synthase II
MGAVTPLGVGVETFWSRLVEGQSGIGPITLFDTEGHDVRIGGECREFDPAVHLDAKAAKRMDRYSLFALASAKEAVAGSGMDFGALDPYRAAVVCGTGIGGSPEHEHQHERLLTKGPRKVSAFTIPKLMVNSASGHLSIIYGIKGESISIGSACASATNAMGLALQYIRSGSYDVVLTGGAEGAITGLSMAAFATMKALSTRNDEPALASRPFDRDRDGFVMADGAGIFVFEELERAKTRGAPILAEVIGFAATSDAEHITQPAEDGEGAAEAMRRGPPGCEGRPC